MYIICALLELYFRPYTHITGIGGGHGRKGRGADTREVQPPEEHVPTALAVRLLQRQRRLAEEPAVELPPSGNPPFKNETSWKNALGPAHLAVQLHLPGESSPSNPGLFLAGPRCRAQSAPMAANNVPLIYFRLN